MVSEPWYSEQQVNLTADYEVYTGTKRPRYHMEGSFRSLTGVAYR